MTIAITGSRTGLSDAQRETARHLLVELKATRILHGACVGADAQAVKEARAIGGCTIAAYPGRSTISIYGYRPLP
jgi:hypothetical protein